MSDQLLRLWPRAERILDEVLDVAEPERERRAIAACQGDAALERAVAALLRADRDCGDFLAVPPAGPPGAEERPAEAATGAPARIGAFRITGELGRGGMGVVLQAERDDGQFQQRVAIKLLHAGAGSALARRSLLRERDILGRLDHPHVARLYDGGVTDEGLPYFVMEFVDGRPIDEHCDDRRLTVEARLLLLRQVCLAVEYAHGRLVVHRDLKPKNVLVGPRGEVKLLDFGIARLLEQAGEATQTVARLLTPVYAAPEQVRGEPVTTATDVYQLGLLLYELLTGHRAHGEPTDSFAALQRRITEEEPMRPSRAVLEAPRSQGESRPPSPGPEDIAARRGTSAEALARRLHGDLDSITLKALRKEPFARYASVEALRRDLDDFLADRPVSARHGTVAYRFRKFARRHRMQVAAAGAVFVSLTVGLVGVIAQGRVAASERDRARLAEMKASAINDFLVHELLLAGTPEKAQGRALTVADVLGGAARAVGHAFRAQPATEAEIRLTIARAYGALGRPGEARVHAEAARRRLAESGRPAEAELLRARRLLAELAIDEGRYPEARVQLEELIADETRLLGEGHEETLATAASLGRALHALGRWAEAETVLRGALARAEAGRRDDWRLAVELRRRLADPLIAQYKAVEAEAICRGMLEVQRARLGPDHPDVAASLQLLALALFRQLRFEDAKAVNEDVVALHERVYGPQHPATADALMALARLYHDALHQYDAGLAAVERGLAIYRNAFGPEHPRTVRALENVGVAHATAKRFSAAEPIYRQVLAIRERTLGRRHPDTLRSLGLLNQMLVAAGRRDEARTAARRLVETYEAALAIPKPDPVLMHGYAEFLSTVSPEDVRNPRRALEVAARAVSATERRQFYPLRELGRAQALTGQPDLAIATLREALALPEALRSWTTEELLVDVLRQHAPPADLEAFLLDRVERLRAARGDREPLIGKTMRFLAQHYERQGRPAEAERYSRLALAQLRKTKREGDWEVARAKSELGERLSARGAYAEAEPLLQEGYSALVADTHTGAPTLEDARRRLVRLYQAWGRPDEAARCCAARHRDGPPRQGGGDGRPGAR